MASSFVQAQIDAAQAKAKAASRLSRGPSRARGPKAGEAPAAPGCAEPGAANGALPDKHREPPGPPKPPPLGWDRPGRYAGEFYRMYSRRYVVATEAQARALDELFYRLIQQP